MDGRKDKAKLERILFDRDFKKLGFTLDYLGLKHFKYKKSNKKFAVEVGYDFKSNRLWIVSLINDKKDIIRTTWVNDFYVQKKSDLLFLLTRFRIPFSIKS